VTIAVVDADEDAFAARLTNAGWTKAYTDDDGGIFTRPAPASP
jgi:hypothetical protein